MLRKIRLLLAVIIFVGLTLLLLGVSGEVHRFTGWMAKVQFLPALLALNIVVIVVLLLLTLVFGRLYCSTICPLGVWQDIVARLSRLIDKKKKYAYSSALPWLRYGFLVVFIVLILAGLTGIASLIAPYSSYARMVVHLFQPVWAFGENGVWNWTAFGVALATFFVVSLLAWRGGRTWCNTVCPVGTVLGILSRFSFLKVRFDADKCTKCGQCARECKASCIDHNTQLVDYSRCVACGNCLAKCKFGALRYDSPVKKSSEEVKDVASVSPDKGRRAFLIGTGLLVGSAFAHERRKAAAGFAGIEGKSVPNRKVPLTPPGSRSAHHFAQHCTACQLCVSECPNHVLRPSTELLRFMQPTMSFEKGFCTPGCTRCSNVCPSGAIIPLRREDKGSVQIGQAVWLRDNCLPVREGVGCGICERHCPTGAISMRPLDDGDMESPMVPKVEPSVCIGCGACEYVCPSRPFPAIYVEGYEEHRRK